MVAALLGASGCATIAGGSRYNAQVVIPNGQNARISYNGDFIGTGAGMVSIKRRDADKIAFTIREEGCPEKTVRFNTRSFRGWALVGSIVTWTGLVQGVPLPWGVGVDLATGAFWKPNVAEPGVSKVNYKNFKYTIPYEGCGDQKADEEVPSDGLDAYYLKDGTVLRAKMIEQLSDGSLKIELADGSVQTYQMAQIERIVRGGR